MSGHTQHAPDAGGGTDTPSREEVHLGSGLASYVRLLRHGPAAWPFVFGALSRLTLAMIPLGLLILVQHQRNSYAIAGVVSGAYAVGVAVGTPLWGRLMDRLGQVAVLAPTALACSALIAGLAFAASANIPSLVLIVLAAAVGFTYPAVSPALRSSFRIALPSAEARQVAFALDVTTVELAYVIGPLLLALLLIPGSALLPLLFTAGLLAVMVIAYCATPIARSASPAVQHAAAGHSGPSTHTGNRSALASTGVLVILGVMLLLSLGFGHNETAMTATAGIELGGTSRAGILFAAAAGGSAVGGLLYGSRTWRIDPRTAAPALLAVFAFFLLAIGGLVATGNAHPVWLIPIMFLEGISVAPSKIMLQALVDDLAPAGRLNEAQAFFAAMITTATAAGTAIAGIVIDTASLAWAFAGAGLAVAAAVILALSGRARLRPTPATAS